MKITRELAILILEYLNNNQNFYFPFLVVCKEYTPEDDDFVEITPEELENIKEDECYQTFELWENLQDLRENTTKFLAKWFIDKITSKTLEDEIKNLYQYYSSLYNEKLTKSDDILKYWENEFFWWKKEAFEEILELIKKY